MTPSAPAKVEVRPRLVVLGQVVYQRPGRDPVTAGTPYGRPVLLDEQPFTRHFTATPEWKPLECGWLASAGMLHLENAEGKSARVQPTDAERAAVAGRVVEIAVQPRVPPHRTMHDAAIDLTPLPFAVLRPGESLRFEPADLSLYRVRCREGTAACVLTLFPG